MSTTNWKLSVISRFCVTCAILAGAWTGLTGASALGAEPIRRYSLPASRQVRIPGATHVVSDAPKENERLRTEEFTRDARTVPQFTPSDLVLEGYPEEEFLPPASVRPGVSRGADSESGWWIENGIVEDLGPAAVTAGRPRRGVVCSPRCPPRARAVRARKCTTSRPMLREEDCPEDLALVPSPACQCTRCRQLPHGCRCRVNRPVCPPDRARLTRSPAVFGQQSDTWDDPGNSFPGEQFATPGTESRLLRSPSSPEVLQPTRSNGNVRNAPTKPLPASPRPLMRPTAPLRPVAVSPRPRYEPMFGEEPGVVPELSLPE